MKFNFTLILLMWSFAALKAMDVPTINQFIKPGTPVFKGMFNVYLQDEKYYMQIPLKLMDRDILTTVTINKGSAQVARDAQQRLGFAGDAVYDGVIRFSKGANRKILLKQPMFYNSADSTSGYYSMLKADVLPVFMSFDVLAADSVSVLFDITPAFTGDYAMFSLKGAKEELKLGSYLQDRSYPLSVSCFKDNIIFRSVRAYGPSIVPAQNGLPAPADDKTPQPGPTVWEVGACWYLLPEIPMKQRFGDKRVGYFMRTIRDYTQDPEKVATPFIASRWRLEPKPEDVERYKRGELVEPAKPIVYYIDRNTPEALRPYFIAGVNAWQKAFEKIGFKNAIMGKLEPTAAEDPDYAIDDVRYSIISYKPSAMPNAYGPLVVDPRSGEILNSHIAVYHNVFDLLQRWYFAMCANIDPRARKIPFSDDVMGRLAQVVVTHEVGHTLGLMHDFAGSSSYDIDSIRNRDFIAKNGFGASIMDYMRFNYVVQPEDNISPDLLLPRIGVYDDYAIEWGYRYLPQFTNPLAESRYLKSWVSEKRKDPRLFYLAEDDSFDPRVQSEDVGDNAMKAGELGINNLKHVMANLEKWTAEADDDNYTVLRQMYTTTVSKYGDYLDNVIKNVGGRYANETLRAEELPQYVPVTKVQQKEAMLFLAEHLFKEPKWLFPASVTNKTRFGFSGVVLTDYQAYMGRIFYKCSQIAANERVAKADAYKLTEFFDDMYDAIFGDLVQAKPISAYRRMMQQEYVTKEIISASNPAYLTDNIAVTMKIQLDRIASAATEAAQKQTDNISKQHLLAIIDMVNEWENGSKDTNSKTKQ